MTNCKECYYCSHALGFKYCWSDNAKRLMEGMRINAVQAREVMNKDNNCSYFLKRSFEDKTNL